MSAIYPLNKISVALIGKCTPAVYGYQYKVPEIDQMTSFVIVVYILDKKKQNLLPMLLFALLSVCLPQHQ